MRRVYRYLYRVTAPDRSGVTWFDLIEIGLVALGFLLYFLVRGAVVDRTRDALANARAIIELQSTANAFIEPAINAWVMEFELAVRFFNFVYFWLDFPLIVAVGLLFFWRLRNHYTVLRDALLISGGFALVLYWLFPVAPPRFFPEWGFVDTLARFSELAYQTQSTKPFVNPFAAVPSLHVGWALLLVIVVFWATRRWFWRAAAVAVFALQSVAVVATANHFIFDGIVGIAVSLPALAVAVWLQRHGYPALRLWLAARAGVSPGVGAQQRTPGWAGAAGKR
jgi:hypothetical protein